MMTEEKQKQTVYVQPKWALYIFGGVGLVITGLSFVSQYLTMNPGGFNIHFPFQADLIKDFNTEFNYRGHSNISDYYHLLVMSLASILLFLIAALKKAAGDKYKFQWTALAWIVWAVVIDDFSSIHEKIGLYLGDLPKTVPIVIGIVIIAALVAIFLDFWRNLEAIYRTLLSLSVLLYIIGFIINAYSIVSYTALEQCLQYGAATILIYSSLNYVRSSFSSFSILL